MLCYFLLLPKHYPPAADDMRYKHFVKRVLPRLRENPQPGALVFVRSYFDFVRVRNLLTSVGRCMLNQVDPCPITYSLSNQ
jgi:hypothetical protein